MDEFGDDGGFDLAPFATPDLPGWISDANLPGDTQGETNGLYAGMTSNNISGDGYTYLSANPGTRDTFLQSFFDTVNSGVRNVAQTRQAITQAQQQARTQARYGSQPTMMQQWAALSPFEKIGAVASLIAIIVYVTKGK